MSSERDAFLKAIEENWTDCELRAIYADWLEERGLDPEESARQRRWAEIMEESKLWIQSFADRIGGRGNYDDTPEPDLGFDGVMEAADEYVRTDDGKWGGEHYFMGTNERYSNECNRMKEFWEHYYNLTGRKCKTQGMFFSCSC